MKDGYFTQEPPEMLLSSQPQFIEQPTASHCQAPVNPPMSMSSLPPPMSMSMPMPTVPPPMSISTLPPPISMSTLPPPMSMTTLPPPPMPAQNQFLLPPPMSAQPQIEVQSAPAESPAAKLSPNFFYNNDEDRPPSASIIENCGEKEKTAAASIVVEGRCGEKEKPSPPIKEQRGEKEKFSDKDEPNQVNIAIL